MNNLDLVVIIMGKILEYFGSQCGNPRGIVGNIMTWGMNRVNKAMYRAIVNSVQLDFNKEILDVGYGNGYLIKLLYNRAKCKIYGIDISGDMLEQASKKNKQGIDEGRIRLSIGDCCNLKFEDESFDVVTTMNTIYFWEDTLKGMQEIHRVLKKGGTFINAVFTKESLEKVAYTRNGFKFFEKEDYINLGNQAGFRNVEFKELQNGSSFLVIYSKL